ncbi:hypothetical protein JZ751_000726 [Albula glossodonta]|uniref:TIR domain-containing protein n=1 Tax=Albula glossodonta TaxID=121402 RepID=A0A8T2PWJ1_9TELE|nr:hypothetical protein JZ751_000726 [Albula glossodonta]
MTSLLLSVAVLLFSAEVCWCYGFKGCTNHYTDKNIIWCSHRNIRDVSGVIKMIPQNATKIDLSRNQIHVLPSDVFKKFWMLQKLTLRRNKISSLKTDQFRGLGELRFLNLSNNDLSEVYPDAFRGLGKLTNLSLYGNHITEIPAGFFEFLPQLRSIALSANKLKHLNSSESNSNMLEVLDLSYNEISWLELNGFPALNYLDLSFNPRLKQMQPPLALNPSLTKLSLWGLGPECLAGISEKTQQALHDVSFSISVQRPDITVCSLLERMPNLKNVNIDLSGSGLLKNTSAFIGCRTPKTIFLKNASLGNISRYQLVKDGKYVTQPSLVKCGLQSIGEKTFQSLTRLSYLDVQGEDDRDLDIHTNTFSVLKKLKKLSLINVGLREPSTDWFQNLQNLESLSMMKNKMTKLTTNAFSALRKLKSLTLRYNLIQLIANQPFCNLSLLQKLDLSVNVITYIENGSFKDLIHLKTLNLGGNRITVLNHEALQGLVHLQELVLYDNQFIFDKDVSPFIKLRSLKILNLSYQGGYIKFGYLGSNFFKGLGNLRNLILSFVTLTKIDVNTFSPLVNLKNLFLSDIILTNVNLTALFTPFVSLTDLFIMKADLDFLPSNLLPPNNSLKYLKIQSNHFHVLEKSIYDNLPLLEYLDVTGNPLSCSCQNAWFKNWSVHNLKVQVAYLYDLHCDNDPLSPYFWEFDDKACSYDYVNFIFFLSTALLDLLILSLGITWHKCRSSIRYLILLLRSRIGGRRKGQRNYTYDAFISYSSLDESWVMEQLVPHMEGPNGKGFRLCLHHRDFRPGVAILENIETAIYNSRRTLCVVSRDFLHSEWCTMEFQLASLRLLCDHNDVLLLVFLEEIPDHCLSMYTQLRRLVRKNTYLVWPEAAADQEAFWIRLEDAMRGGVEDCPDSPEGFPDSLVKTG